MAVGYLPGRHPKEKYSTGAAGPARSLITGELLKPVRRPRKPKVEVAAEPPKAAHWYPPPTGKQEP
jgi:hypothetical protein